MTMEKQLRVLFADDHVALIRGFARELEPFGIECVDVIGNPLDIKKSFLKHKPDVVVCDMRFTDATDGLTYGGQLIDDYDAKVIFFSQFDQAETIKRCIHRGAKGYLTKDTDIADLAQAIRDAADNRVTYPQKIVEAMANRNSSNPQDKLAHDAMAVFKRLVKGWTLEDIAKNMGWHKKSISNLSVKVRNDLGLQSNGTQLLMEMRELAKEYDLLDSRIPERWEIEDVPGPENTFDGYKRPTHHA